MDEMKKLALSFIRFRPPAAVSGWVPRKTKSRHIPGKSRRVRERLGQALIGTDRGAIAQTNS
jgi:hypothetical protein